jgi:hypothetical protein
VKHVSSKLCYSLLGCYYQFWSRLVSAILPYLNDDRAIAGFRVCPGCF